MNWIRETDSDQVMSEIELLSRDLARPILRAGRRIPVQWWNSATSRIPVHDGEPQVRFDTYTLDAEEESVLAGVIG